MSGSVVLTLHGITSDSLPTVITEDKAALRYTIDESLFDILLELLGDKTCLTLSDLKSKSQSRGSVVLTFDDGLVTDHEIVFPKLLERNIPATFYVTVENIGKKGYCGIRELQEMANKGMELGSHGWTHTYLVTKSKSEVIHEIVDSKAWLEDKLGLDVKTYAPVGGHYENWMEQLAYDAGYETFATMIPGKVSPGSSSSRVKRNHIQSHFTKNDVAKVICQSAANDMLNSSRYLFLRLLKSTMGMERYDRLKKTILGNN